MYINAFCEFAKVAHRWEATMAEVKRAAAKVKPAGPPAFNFETVKSEAAVVDIPAMAMRSEKSAGFNDDDTDTDDDSRASKEPEMMDMVTLRELATSSHKHWRSWCRKIKWEAYCPKLVARADVIRASKGTTNVHLAKPCSGLWKWGY